MRAAGADARGSPGETCIITSSSDTVGLIYLDSRQTAVDLSSGNRELLQTLALEASTILENARLLEEERVKQRMEEELSIAREIQIESASAQAAVERLVPRRRVEHSLARGGRRLFRRAAIGPDVWAAVVTDVSGKGVSSALLAALLQGSFLRRPTSTHGIEQMMIRINLFLNERTEGEKYATVFYCILYRATE